MYKRLLLACLTLACLALGALLLGTPARAAGYPESAHPYANDASQTWTYAHPSDAAYLKVTFSAETDLENGFDFLSITDATGVEARYTGPSLAGRTLYFKGSKLTLKLTTDRSGAYYGFRITSIGAATEAQYNTPRFIVSGGRITGFSGRAGNLNIPATVDGQTVTAIGNSLFAGNAELTAVTIPDTVTSIGYAAFEGCPALKTATLSAKLADIGGYAFRNCAALTSISLPDTVTGLGYAAFEGCAALKTVRLSAKLTRIESYAFNGCAALTSISLPNGVTDLGASAFAGCSALKTVRLPAALTDVGSYAFQNCEALASVSLPDGVTRLGYRAFSGCAALKTAVLSSKLTEIGDYAFQGCAALTSVSLPEAVASLGVGAFSGCKALKTAALSSKLTEIPDSAFYNCAALSEVAIPSRVTRIGNYAFYGCSALKAASLPTRLTEIGREGFGWCSSLSAVSLPNAVTALGDYAFYGCGALRTFSVGTGSQLSAIGAYAFHSCASLEAIVVPAGVARLERWCFAGCSALKTIRFRGEGVELGEYALYNCGALTAVGVPITAWGKNALKNDGALTAIEFADSVPALDEDAIDDLAKCMYVVVTVGKDSPIYPQLKAAGVCYRVRESGETNRGQLPTTTIRGQVERIFATCVTGGMSDYEKALALHDWLVANAEYDYTYSNYDAGGVLLEGKGVCQSYASAYALLLDYAGIPNDFEYGDDHMWNMVKLGGQWYHVDVTWDDDGDSSRYNYFGLSNYAIETVSNHECFNRTHVTSAYKYNYAFRGGQLNPLIREARIAIAAGLDAGEGTVNYARYDGLSTRTAILALRDREFTANGRPVALDIDYDTRAGGVVAKVVMQAPDLTLPAALRTVQPQAFRGMGAGVVRVPDRSTAIGAKAFADCPNLWQIFIPASVASIADDAFAGVEKLIIFGKAGSPAQTFAIQHGYGFVAE